MSAVNRWKHADNLPQVRNSLDRYRAVGECDARYATPDEAVADGIEDLLGVIEALQDKIEQLENQ